LQEWYKRNYESFLFKDRRYLYNILMFIANARAGGTNDDEIRKMLLSKKWANEQISYALKKSRGQRTGMYEIIPIEKLFAWLRKRKAEKSIATDSRQQNMQNINKYSNQGINRRIF